MEWALGWDTQISTGLPATCFIPRVCDRPGASEGLRAVGSQEPGFLLCVMQVAPMAEGQRVRLSPPAT